MLDKILYSSKLKKNTPDQNTKNICVGDYVYVFKKIQYTKDKKNVSSNLKYEGCVIKKHKNLTFRMFNKTEGYMIDFFLLDPKIEVKIVRKYKTFFHSLKADLSFLTQRKLKTKKQKLLSFIKKKNKKE